MCETFFSFGIVDFGMNENSQKARVGFSKWKKWKISYLLYHLKKKATLILDFTIIEM